MHGQIRCTDITSRAHDRAITAAINMNDISQLSCIQRLFNQIKSWIKTQKESCSKYFVIIFCNLVQCFSIRQLFCQWFFQKNMFLISNGNLYRFTMHIIRKYNGYSFNLRIRQHILIILVRFTSVGFLCQCTAVIVIFTNCGKLYTW